MPVQVAKLLSLQVQLGLGQAKPGWPWSDEREICAPFVRAGEELQ